MERPLLISLFFISLTSCFDKSKSSHVDTTIAKSVDTTIKPPTEIYTDSTVTLFGDNTYKLTLHIFDTANDYDAERKNAVLTFSRLNGNQTEIFFRDSMFSMYPNIDFQDFNNDKVKDILIFYYTGARANPTYHLYLTDLKNRKLIRVKGFEELPNPDLDTTHNIIESIALSGTNYYSFYRINSNNRLINLGHSFGENPKDSTQYERALRQIIKKHK
ncbi:MAG: XAC2610-related protein [Flavisolibacter sp.]